MFEEVKKQITNIFPRAVAVKDIFLDDKLTQAEKRYQRFRESESGGESAIASLLLMFGLGQVFLFIGGEYGFLGLSIGLILSAGASYLFYLEYLKRPMFKRLPNYFSCIAESKNGSLDDISAYLGYPYEIVISDIDFLINKGILEKSFINHSKRVIVSPLIGEAVLKYSSNRVCSNCGATNKIIGQTSECEYCGSTVYK